MSEFHELVKTFSKTREYVRDFFVYGFKSRNEFKDKSPRTYDNERRRLESWLAPFVRKDYGPNGCSLSLAIDSNLLDINPLFEVWKTKSFTDNDIVLHFLILDLLKDGKKLTAEEITDRLLLEYEVLFDIQAVRRKCNSYVKEGLLEKTKNGKTIVFSSDYTLALWLKSNETMQNALSFFQMAGNFGMVGNFLSDQFDFCNHSFRTKHSFFVHTLEEEVLLDLLNAMNQHRAVKLELKSSKTGVKNTVDCIPLQIFSSARSGRRFLCGYVEKRRRFTCFRLDSIKGAVTAEVSLTYDKLLEKLNKNRQRLWGVSFQSATGRHLDKIAMTIQAIEPAEHYIVERLIQEGRGGSVTEIAKNTFLYENEVFDCNEMLPWIRTFIGRILSLDCTDKFVEQRFYLDLQAMYQIYDIEKETREHI